MGGLRRAERSTTSGMNFTRGSKFNERVGRVKDVPTSAGAPALLTRIYDLLQGPALPSLDLG